LPPLFPPLSSPRSEALFFLFFNLIWPLTFWMGGERPFPFPFPPFFPRRQRLKLSFFSFFCRSDYFVSFFLNFFTSPFCGRVFITMDSTISTGSFLSPSYRNRAERTFATSLPKIGLYVFSLFSLSLFFLPRDSGLMVFFFLFSFSGWRNGEPLVFPLQV